MKLYTINTGFFRLDGGAMFGVVPKTIWNKLNPADENNLCNWAMRSLLVEDGDRLILIDNGIGDKQDAKFFSHYHLNGNDSLDGSLAAQGFHRNDITDVILTHLHFDHCGGSIRREGERLVPAFPNALYWSNERHWQWATVPNDREKASFLGENILPIRDSGRLRMVPMEEGKHSVFSDNITIRFVNGHTDAMMLPQIRYGERTIVFAADLLPAAAHLPMAYVMAYDMFPLTTMHEKKAFLTEAVEKDYVLFFQHDPVHECCTVKGTERGVRPAALFPLKELQ
jgi:glyoxylase-like metal-dependent hydrolase (beta-lactamase superfamily II)